MPTTKEILISARALIEKPENWTQGTEAKDINDNPVDWNSDAAVKFCIYGAMDRAAETRDASSLAINAWCEATGIGWPGSWNDATNRTHSEVIASIDKAIAEAA